MSMLIPRSRNCLKVFSGLRVALTEMAVRVLSMDALLIDLQTLPHLPTDPLPPKLLYSGVLLGFQI